MNDKDQKTLKSQQCMGESLLRLSLKSEKNAKEAVRFVQRKNLTVVARKNQRDRLEHDIKTRIIDAVRRKGG